RNSRRVRRWPNFSSSMGQEAMSVRELLLDGELGGRRDEMNNRACPIPPLGLGGIRVRVGNVRGVLDVILNDSLGRIRKLAREHQSIECVNQGGKILIVGPGSRASGTNLHPRIQIDDNIRRATSEAAEAAGRPVEETIVEKVRLAHDIGVRSQLELRRDQASRGKYARELVVRGEEIKHRRR